MPTKLDLKTVPDLKPNPIFDGMSDELKNPDNFLKIEKQLSDILISDHAHPTVKSYVKCKRCQEKYKKRQAMMKEMGFSGIEQFTEWRKIQTIIRNKQSFDLR